MAALAQLPGLDSSSQFGTFGAAHAGLPARHVSDGGRDGVSENGVLVHLKRAGVTLRPAGKVTQAEVAEMARLRGDGWTYAAIGDRFDVTSSAIKLRLDRVRAHSTDPFSSR